MPLGVALDDDEGAEEATSTWLGVGGRFSGLYLGKKEGNIASSSPAVDRSKRKGRHEVPSSTGRH